MKRLTKTIRFITVETVELSTVDENMKFAQVKTILVH